MKIHGGWTKTPNEIYETIPKMSTPELLCTLILVRETYGYHRRRVRLTYASFMRATGIKGKSTISAALRDIEARGLFKRTAVPSVWQIVEQTVLKENDHHE